MAAPSRPSPKDCITILLSELRQCIVERLPWGRDVANFRLTGKLWRDTVPLVKFTPLLMLPFDPESPDGAVPVTFYRPTDGETITKNLPALHGKVVCGSSHGWLALEDVSATVTLLNPFTGATVDLPPADKYVGREKSMRHARMDADGSRYLIKLDKVRDVFFRDIVLSSPPDSGNCVAMALVPCSRVVAFCRVGVDPAWRTLLIEEPLPRRLPCWVPIISIVHCRGTRFLAVGQDRQVFICDAAAFAAPTATLVPSLLLPLIRCRGYLHVNGELHFVGSFMRGYQPNRTQVYKCTDVFATNPSWSRVQDVGDMTLFVSKNFMAGFSGPSVLGLTKNAVYFSEPVVDDRPQNSVYSSEPVVEGPQKDQDHELEISDIDNGTSELLGYHKKTASSWLAPCWIQPKPNPWTQGAHGNA